MEPGFRAAQPLSRLQNEKRQNDLSERSWGRAGSLSVHSGRKARGSPRLLLSGPGPTGLTLTDNVAAFPSPRPSTYPLTLHPTLNTMMRRTAITELMLHSPFIPQAPASCSSEAAETELCGGVQISRPLSSPRCPAGLRPRAGNRGLQSPAALLPEGRQAVPLACVQEAGAETAGNAPAPRSCTGPSCHSLLLV